LTQIFGVGVVHADPHPGHVHVTPMATSFCPASVRQDGASMRGS
jgi:predicted unusual protein kinase regulating ubiquinone biosynthesis (AarF/ABC1/UbiB family)